MGGVPKRFPQLKFAFMEGGVGWARTLYCDLVSHWAKRKDILTALPYIREECENKGKNWRAAQ